MVTYRLQTEHSQMRVCVEEGVAGGAVGHQGLAQNCVEGVEGAGGTREQNCVGGVEGGGGPRGLARNCVRGAGAAGEPLGEIQSPEPLKV